MLISKKSPLTGLVNTMEIDVTYDQLNDWKLMRRSIQNVMPHLTADEREFLMTGYTSEDWAVLFPPEEGEEEG